MRVNSWINACIFTLLASSLWSQTPTVLAVPSTAFPTIQSAISAAQNGDQINVAAGTYFENLDLEGKRIAIIGSGSSTCTIDGSLAPTTTILLMGDVGAGNHFEGLTITGGSGWIHPVPIPGEIAGGGGMWIGKIAPLGIVNPNPDFVTILDCVFTNNVAPGGAGMCAAGYGLDLRMEDCVFEDNHTIVAPIATGRGPGGAITSTLRRMEMTGCVVRNNSANNGGGINGAGGEFTIIDCLFEGNQAADAFSGLGGGGAIAVSFGKFHFENSRFYNNSANQGGGAVVLFAATQASPNMELRNCEFVGNSSGTWPSVSIDGAGVIENCTIAGGTSTMFGDLYAAPHAAGLTIVNTNIWGNSAGFITHSGSNPLTLMHCNIEGGFPGTMNRDVDPMFRDPANGDYHLRPESPLIDQGLSTATTLTSFDIDGDLRELLAGPDIGADEVNDAALGPYAAGASSVPGGLLTISGSTGNIAKRVLIPAGSTWTIELAAPPGILAPKFVLAGGLGVPQLEHATLLPFGIGTMALPPCPLFPQFANLLFTMTNNLGALPCNQILASHPAPWSSVLLPSLPAGTELTFQGIIEDGAGGFEITNLVVAEF